MGSNEGSNPGMFQFYLIPINSNWWIQWIFDAADIALYQRGQLSLNEAIRKTSSLLADLYTYSNDHVFSNCLKNRRFGSTKSLNFIEFLATEVFGLPSNH